MTLFFPPVPGIAVRKNTSLPDRPECVLYWMQRSQRDCSNQALDTAAEWAERLDLPLAVVFVLVPDYPGSTEKHYSFMLKGLYETEQGLKKKGAAFFVCEASGSADQALLEFIKELRPAILIGDENPLKIPELWRKNVAEKIEIPYLTVDSDVVVPSSIFQKEEYSARTLRSKITPLIALYLEKSSEKTPSKKWKKKIAPKPGLFSDSIRKTVLWNKLFGGKTISAESGALCSADDVPVFSGGRNEALAKLSLFVDSKLGLYSEERNKPEKNGTSNLSPYLHFGQISPAEAAQKVFGKKGEDKHPSHALLESSGAFIEELIVRRELAVNYVLRNRNYDSVDGFHEWARKTLTKHSRDTKEHIYTPGQFEEGETHDKLWNAAQQQMRESGFMHGYMRMYWAKKILEWSRSPEDAFGTAVYLNDKYSLDGRDPNGYTGIAWSIGGKHDRPWGPEREIFGLVRYMNLNGMKRKFDTKSYIAKYGKGGSR